MRLLAQGLSQAEVARRCGVSRVSVWRWEQRRRSGGSGAWKRRPLGRPPKLKATELHRLEKALLRGGRAHGFADDQWTLRRVAEVIRRQSGVRLHPGQLKPEIECDFEVTCWAGGPYEIKFANPRILTTGYSNPASVHAICDGETTLVRYRTVGVPGFGLDNERLEQQLVIKGCRELWDVMPGRVPNSGHGWMEKYWWLWLQYCVSVADLRKIGKVYQPATLWATVGSKQSLLPLYWEWDFLISPDGRYVERGQLVRRDAMKLRRVEDAFTLPVIDYPDDIASWRGMFYGGRDLPIGFVRFRYECAAWTNVGGFRIPKSGMVKWYPSTAYKNPMMVDVIEAINAEVLNVPLPVLPQPSSDVMVHDYRYRRVGNKRVFRYAEYVLPAGQSLRGTNDPELLAQAERHLRRGRKYYEPPIERRHWVLWAMLPVVMLPPAAYLVWVLGKRRATGTGA